MPTIFATVGGTDVRVKGVDNGDGTCSLSVGGTVTIDPGALATSANQTNGTAKTIVHGVAKGATAAADATVRTIDADHNAVDVVLNGTVPLPTGAATAAGQATEHTDLAAILSKQSSDPSTATLQGTGNTALASILAKLIAAPATEAKQASLGASTAATSASVVYASDGDPVPVAIGGTINTLPPYTNTDIGPGRYANRGAATGAEVVGGATCLFAATCLNLGGADFYLLLFNVAGGAAPSRAVGSNDLCYLVPAGTQILVDDGDLTDAGFPFPAGLSFAVSTSPSSYVAIALAANQHTQIRMS